MFSEKISDCGGTDLICAELNHLTLETSLRLAPPLKSQLRHGAKRRHRTTWLGVNESVTERPSCRLAEVSSAIIFASGADFASTPFF
jgi:hypothetical protein